MEIRSCMKRDIAFVPATITVRRAAEILVDRHIGLLPVVGENDYLLGMVSMHDVLTVDLPDLGAVEAARPGSATLDRPVTALMQPAVTVHEDCDLVNAYTMMRQHRLLDLPVVAADGRLVGLVSHVDIGTAILANWKSI